MVDLTRRAFFKALIAGAAVAAIGLPSHDPDKYDRALGAARNIAQHTKNLRASVARSEYGKHPEFLSVQSEAQNLFTVINDHFECTDTPEVRRSVGMIMRGEKTYEGMIYDVNNERLARSILETVFVIAVARDLVRHEQAPLVTKMIPAFDMFARNHRDILDMNDADDAHESLEVAA